MKDTSTRIARLQVHGLGYGPAVEAIALALAAVPGVRSAKVIAASSTAFVECQPEVGGADLLGVLGSVGFRGELLAA
jgi:copper chaperone CopZ